MSRVVCHGMRCGRPIPHGQTYCPRCRPARKTAKPTESRSYRGTALWRALRQQAWERDQGTCQRCYRRVQEGQDWDLGHIIPHAQGGPLTLDNVRVEHDGCNRRHNRPRPKGHR